MSVRWRLVHRFNQEARVLADRHYNRQKVGSPQFTPPGRVLVLVSDYRGSAYWATSWPFSQYVRHAWPGAWVCSAFRSESRMLSSALIRQAVSVTRWFHQTEPSWRVDALPSLGMVTFVDPRKVRAKEQPGRCFLEAGFVRATPPETAGGLLAFQLLPAAMPEPRMPLNAQPALGLAA